MQEVKQSLTNNATETANVIPISLRSIYRTPERTSKRLAPISPHLSHVNASGCLTVSEELAT